MIQAYQTYNIQIYNNNNNDDNRSKRILNIPKNKNL